MWTPKRILLLTAGFFLFFTTYAVYAHFLGGIDGLPALPRDYWPSDEPPTPIETLEIQKSDADRKLIMAFGEDCEEVKQRTIKLYIKDRGMVLATNFFGIEPDGRVKLKPFSIALFGKERDNFSFPEINTVRCKEAYLQFDRPVTSPTEMGNRKIIGGELRGWTIEDGKKRGGTIRITNNRRTPQQNDDIQITISQDPLFYKEADHKIWTKGVVELLDTQSKPKPTSITAEGMDLFLTTAVPVTANRPVKKPKGETVSGVDRVVLHKNVRMFLQVDARSGFLGNSRTNPVPAGKPSVTTPDLRARSLDSHKPQESSAPIMIDTDGPFSYDVPKDIATFDIPARAPRKKGGLEPPQVLVFRIHDIGEGDKQAKLYDQLLCDHLTLKFRRKANPDPRAPRANSNKQSGDREIESAHATAHPTADHPSQVVISLDTENLEASGEDLVYRCATASKGPETILKGSPLPKGPLLKAIKDCNIIQARELWLVGALEKGGPQQATAKGPGRIDLVDHASSTLRYPVQIYWKDTLTSTKDGRFDVLTLTRDARFVDQDHHQELQADRIKVWLEPAERAAPEKSAPAGKQVTPAAKSAPRQRPHQLEAFEHVSLHSPEMNIQDTDHLTVFFADADLGKGELPAALPDLDKAKGLSGDPGAGKRGNPPATLKADNGPSRNPIATPAGNTTDKETKKPINLWARSVKAWINRLGPKNELDHMVTRGNVHVHQEGSKPGDKGVDIKGETLELVRQYDVLHRPLGDLLVVLGEAKARKSAELQLGEMFLVGPKVTIDQKENTAEVQGIGLMNMPSNTSFEGGKPTKPGTRLTVQWTKGMLFNGKDADFHGKVSAVQDNSHMLCEALQVTLDRVVSFKEGQKGGQAAKVEKLVADRQVMIEEKVTDNGKLVKHHRLVCQALAMDNKEGPVIASGPGVVYLLQPGAVDNELAGTAPATGRTRTGATPPPKMEMKLTRIEFDGRMFSNNKPSNRIAKFYDKVEVSSFPAEKMDAPFNKDKPPERGMYLSCEKLTVYTSPLPQGGGKNSQTLFAEKNVLVRTPDSLARAAKVTFEEAKDLIIFEGIPGTPATFYKNVNQPGVQPQGFKGQKIFYNRRTKQHMGEGLQSITYE